MCVMIQFVNVWGRYNTSNMNGRQLVVKIHKKAKKLRSIPYIAVTSGMAAYQNIYID